MRKGSYTKKMVAALAAFLFILQSLIAQIPVANFTASPLAGCSPLIVNFQDFSSGNPTSWKWDFGNGNISTLQNPTSTYFTPGKYTVTLTVANAAGTNTLTRSQLITVYEAPTVLFNASPVTGCLPLNVQFNDSSSAGAGNTDVNWFWDFGDGTTSTNQNPLHQYINSGNFTVVLKVTNDKGCSKVLVKPSFVQVNPGIVPGFTNTQVAVCKPPATVSFTNTSSGPGTLNYLWGFGDGISSNAVNPTHTYTTTGLYSVTLIVANNTGCVDTLTKKDLIAVGSYATSFSAPDTVCINSPVSFINNSLPNPSSASWNFGDGTTSSVMNPVKTYNTAGTFPVKLINNYNSCLDSITKNIVVLSLPVPNFTAPVTGGCATPFTVNFQDQSANAAGWLWNFGDNTSSTSQNPTHTYNNFGSYDVTLIVINTFGCRDSITKKGFIKIQAPKITIPGLPAAGCIPYTINPVANITTPDMVTSYLWNFGDGATSTVQNPSHTYTIKGTYTVSLVITTSTGCTDTLTIPGAIKVGTLPTVNFTASPTTVCAFQPVQFTDQSSNVDQWSWSFGDGSNSGSQNPSHTYTMPGTFTVSLTGLNNGCPVTVVKNNYITVNPPVANFTFTPNCANRFQFLFTDKSTGALTWLWNFGDGATSTLQNPVHNFPALGTYSVSLTVTNGACSNTYTTNVFAIHENPDFTASPPVLCRGNQTVLQATNMNLSNIVNYYWNTGDGFQNYAPSVFTHTYSNSGTYSVSLITTDINGCHDTAAKANFISVNGPIANFTAANTGGCKGLVTTFNDLSTTDGTHPIVKWHWDFGDGTVQDFTTGPFTHTYNTPGTFSVKLTVTDASGCSDSLSKSKLVIATNPIANFTSTDTLSCPGATVSFQNTSQSLFSYASLWNFGNGNSSILQNPGNVYTVTGNYTITLRITDSLGCSDSITKTAFIHISKPVAGFMVNDSVSSCIPLQVNFTNTSQYYSSVLWTFGADGNSTLNNPTHYFGLPGTYPVTLMITSPGGCVDSAKKNIILYDTAGTSIKYAPLAGCNPLPVSFHANTTDQFTYLWDFGDGNTQTTTVPDASHVYTTFGNFSPRVILQDPAGCLIPVAGVDTLRIVGSKANFGLDKKLLCDSGWVNFTDSTTFNDPIAGWNWNFGDGSTSTLQNPSHHYASAGNYSVSLITQTQAGCRDTANFKNVLKIVQSPLVAIQGDSVACVFSTLQQQGVFVRNDTSAVNWTWSFPNNNVSNLQNPPAQLYTGPGNFVINAIATNSSGCSDTAKKNITINPLPVINIPGTITILSGSSIMIPATYSPNVYNWQWSPVTGLNCTGCPQPVAGPKFNTTYTVAALDSNGCRNTASVNIVVICKDGNIFIPNTFSPNGDGNNDIFYPRGKGIDHVQVLRIFNRWGEVVFEKMNFPVNDASQGWDGRYKGKAPQPGVYIYQVEVYCSNGDLITLDGNVSLIQ